LLAPICSSCPSPAIPLPWSRARPGTRFRRGGRHSASRPASGSRPRPSSPPPAARAARASWSRISNPITSEDCSMASVELEQELKRLIVSALNLEDIAPEEIDSDEPLFGDGLGLDSIDGLELGVAIRKTYGVTIEAKKEEVRKIFANVKSIAAFIASQKGGL